MPSSNHRIFRALWWACNLSLLAAFLTLVYSGGWEYSVRTYLGGFSDAIVPAVATPEQKVEAILNWMRSGPPRAVVADPDSLPRRDPETTLNYQQLLSVCGTATNAFLNLSKSANLQVRRLLLLDPNRRARHVVAEVLMDGRWIVIDPTYRTILRDAKGRLLTRRDLQDNATFVQATSAIPNYPAEYRYDSVAHVRIGRLPVEGMRVRRLLDSIYPGWEEAADWSLLLERESYFYLASSGFCTFFLVLLRMILGWYADRRLQVPRFHLREKVYRAGAALLSAPEIKQ